MNFINIVRVLLNLFDSFQQKKIINFLKEQSIDKLVIFDVGSHHGETVSLFVKNFNIEKIHCFEASRENFIILQKNIKKNFLNSLCQLNNYAAGDKKKKTYL